MNELINQAFNILKEYEGNKLKYCVINYNERTKDEGVINKYKVNKKNDVIYLSGKKVKCIFIDNSFKSIIEELDTCVLIKIYKIDKKINYNNGINITIMIYK